VTEGPDRVLPSNRSALPIAIAACRGQRKGSAHGDRELGGIDGGDAVAWVEVREAGLLPAPELV